MDHTGLAEGVSPWCVTLQTTGGCVQATWRLIEEVQVPAWAEGLQSTGAHKSSVWGSRELQKGYC